MNKRERLGKTLAGEATDRLPVSLWRYWPGDDQRAADLARSTVEFQQTYDWDFVKITPAESYCVTDYGVQDEWQGDPEGIRHITRRAVTRSLEWTELRPLDPTRGTMGRQIDAIRLIGEGLRHDEAPITQSIMSPLSQAGLISGNDLLIRHIRQNPDRVQTALNAITESTLRFLDAIKKLLVDGIYYSIHHATFDMLTEEEYRVFGLPYDRKILESLPEKWWFNLLHLTGKAPMFRLCTQLPVQGVNWPDQVTEPNLSQAKLQINGAVCGGLTSEQHLQYGTPASIREQIRLASTETNSRRLIVSAERELFVTTPISNIRAVRDTVRGAG